MAKSTAVATAYSSSTQSRIAREPDSRLLPSEIKELFWFFGDLEAELGVCSTFGAQCERAALSMPVEEAVLDARRYRRERVRDWVALGHGANDAGSPKWDTIEMPVHETRAFITQDPYEDDAILKSVQRAARIRAHLRRCDYRSVLVLHAVYGPAMGNEADRQSIRLKFGNLVEIVVAIVAASRDDTDPSARKMVVKKLTDDTFVRMLKNRASGILRDATADYAGCR